MPSTPQPGDKTGQSGHYPGDKTGHIDLSLAEE